MHPPSAEIAALASDLADELIAVRRDLHRHPELGRTERRTTKLLADRLLAAGLRPHVMPSGAGLWCDVGDDSPSSLIAIRADLDALPIDDELATDYRSMVPGVSHACGHDVHTAVVLGVGLVMQKLAASHGLPGGVRLVFQPAEEGIPGGALDVIEAGGLDSVSAIYCVHCDPRQDVGTIGLRSGPITGSSDHLHVTMSGGGGHTARPHLTADLVYALAKVVTDVPAVLSRRVDPRAGLSVVWGRITAGSAANVIPQRGEAEGTVRSLDPRAWEQAPETVTTAVRSVAATYGIPVQVEYTRGVPPVINDPECVSIMTAAAKLASESAVFEVEQSLGGEDFAWYLEKVPGALARLGVRTPGDDRVRDLHQGTFDIDERAIATGVEFLANTAWLAMQATR